MNFESLKSLFIEKYVDQNDWRTVEWDNLNDFLKRFHKGFIWVPIMPKTMTTTSFMSTTTTTLTSLSTSSSFTTHWDVMHRLYPDITRDINNRIHAMEICPDKDFTAFKILIHKYLELYENLVKSKYRNIPNDSPLSDAILFYPRSSVSRTSKLERLKVLSKNLLAYKKLFMGAIDHEVNDIFRNKPKHWYFFI